MSETTCWSPQIGGGIAGLYAALRLIEAGTKDVVLYESRRSLGGRVQTTRNDKGEPLFNDFAWRVGETNERMLALAKVSRLRSSYDC